MVQLFQFDAFAQFLLNYFRNVDSQGASAIQRESVEKGRRMLVNRIDLRIQHNNAFDWTCNLCYLAPFLLENLFDLSVESLRPFPSSSGRFLLILGVRWLENVIIRVFDKSSLVEIWLHKEPIIYMEDFERVTLASCLVLPLEEEA